MTAQIADRADFRGPVRKNDSGDVPRRQGIPLVLADLFALA